MSEEDRNARCSNCGSFDLRVANVTGGCCKTDEHTEAWQKIGCMDCGQDLGRAFDEHGRPILFHRAISHSASPREAAAEFMAWLYDENILTQWNPEEQAELLDKWIATKEPS